jgi:type IV fimbrial biogenesis protein FimT
MWANEFKAPLRCKGIPDLLRIDLRQESVSLRQHTRCSSGISMPESLMVISIISILLAVLAPILPDAMLKIRQKQIAQTLSLGMTQARSEAIKRNSRVTLCKSSDGMFCSKFGGWSQGWIVFHDGNNSGAREAFEELISTSSKDESSVFIMATGSVGNYVSFNPMGYSRLSNGGFQAGTFKVCPINAKVQDAYNVVLNSVGRVRMETVSVSECSVN